MLVIEMVNFIAGVFSLLFESLVQAAAENVVASLLNFLGGDTAE